MVKALLITDVFGDGINEEIRPRLDDEFNVKWEDQTGNEAQPPIPNSVVVLCWLTESDFDIINNDMNYYMLWDVPNPKPPKTLPTQAEWGQLNAFLAKQGYTPTMRKQAIGKNINGRNRAEIAEQLKLYLRNR